MIIWNQKQTNHILIDVFWDGLFCFCFMIVILPKLGIKGCPHRKASANPFDGIVTCFAFPGTLDPEHWEKRKPVNKTKKEKNKGTGWRDVS